MVLRNELLGVADQLLAQCFVVEILARGSVPGFGGFDADGGFGFDCAFAGLGEVVVGVAEEGGDAAGDGFDDVLAAGINEAAADEGNVCAEVVAASSPMLSPIQTCVSGETGCPSLRFCTV